VEDRMVEINETERKKEKRIKRNEDNIYKGLVFVSIQPVFVFWLGHSIHLHLR